MRLGPLCAGDSSSLRQPIRMRDRYPGNGRALVPFSVVLLFLIAPLCRSQQTPPRVSIHVQVDQSDRPISPVWNYFGYDEPNYTYAPNGKKLLGELAALDAAPVYVRVHNLLTSGDGSSFPEVGIDQRLFGRRFRTSDL
jgi:hypothetical protein